MSNQQTLGTAEERQCAAEFLEDAGWFGVCADIGATITARSEHTECLQKLLQTYGGSVAGDCWKLQGEIASKVMVDLHPLMSPLRQSEIDRALSYYLGRGRGIPL
jgi:hypothetical protein